MFFSLRHRTRLSQQLMFLSFLNVQTQFDKISIIIKIASFIFKDTAEDVNRIRKHSFGTIYVNKDCNNSAIYFHMFESDRY